MFCISELDKVSDMFIEAALITATLIDTGDTITLMESSHYCV